MSTVAKLLAVPYPDFKRNDTIASSNFDDNNAAVVAKLDAVIDAFNKLENTTDGDSGGDNIQITAIPAVGVATKLQEFLEALVAQLTSVVDSDSGADFVGVTAITDVTGATVQAVLEAIKAQLEAHKTSADHNDKYYTETELNAGQLDNRYRTETELSDITGVGGSALIGTPALDGASATNVKDQLAQLRALITQTQIGQIADGSITNNKLALDVKVGSLATLLTTIKSSVIEAINELVSNIGDITTLITTDKSDIVSSINEIETSVNTNKVEFDIYSDLYKGYSTNKDANGVYTTYTLNRRTDDSKYYDMVLSNANVNGQYETSVEKYYGADGTTILKTITWTLTYDVADTNPKAFPITKIPVVS